jgi:hypothetical protein
MNDEQLADRLLQTWLDSEAPTTVPPGLLDRINNATRSARLRPAWIARLEGHHMDVIEGGRRTGVPRLGLVFVVIAVAVALVAAIGFAALQNLPTVVVPAPTSSASPQTTPTAESTPEPSLEPRPARVVSAGSLIDGRAEHVATLLADGRVLISGGTAAHEPHAQSYLMSTEIWDPLTNTTTASGSVDPAVDHLLRTTQDAFLLSDGRVLIVPGGCVCRPMPTAPAEIWDPSSGSWRAIPGMTITRVGHSATLLADGRVLIAGGGSPPFDGGPAAADAFIWDAIRETSTPTGSMNTARGYHTTTLLGDGRVLFIGGSGTTPEEPVTSAEIWDPRSGSFAVVPSLEDVRGTAVTLLDGRVLVVDESTATLWDPGDDSVSAAGSLVNPRSGFTVTLLADGRVLIVGDDEFLDAEAAVTEVELWDPATLRFEAAGTLSHVRSGHTTTALPDGRALIVGGRFGEFAGAPLQEIEIWEPPRG